ncbi:hypothetical protein GIB67_023597 [Kingdonia uniflora]|uniref:Cytochrome P450 n=1 Tax=Kingdonia uniflora TaxID=39325 RepID=A0A7J7L4Z4_9MAGN|nr:hypothetical protein GIB67_023597 [Kingdonia uniflora]
MFHSVRAEEVRAMIIGLCQKAVARVDMKAMFSELSLNVMMMMIAGKRYYGENVDEEEVEKGRLFRELVRENFSMSGTSNPLDFFPLLKWVGFGGIEKKIVRLKEKRDEFLQDLIEEKKSLRLGCDYYDAEKKGKESLIDVLLLLQETEPEYYTDQMIRGMISVRVS